MFEGDENEIEVPKSIQDLIESKIRTLSNSLSTAKSASAAAVQEAIQNADNIVTICAMNRSAQQTGVENTNSQLLKELGERWYTKGELERMQQEIDPQRTASHDLNNKLLNPVATTNGQVSSTECNLTRVKVTQPEEETNTDVTFKQARRKVQNNRKK